MGDYERVLMVKNECFVYRLPPRPSNRGYKAADWGLDKPHWTGRMRIVEDGKKLWIKLEERNGALFAKAPVESHPGVAVESVNDSSRYFVLRIMDDTGRTAFIGAGFADRGDAFDFNVSLQDYFKQIKTEEKFESSPPEQQNLNLQLKEGQTFRINIGNSASKNKAQSKPRPQPGTQAGGILLPPPPGGIAAPAPPNETKTDSSDWGEFSSSNVSNNGGNVGGWVQF